MTPKTLRVLPHVLAVVALIGSALTGDTPPAAQAAACTGVSTITDGRTVRLSGADRVATAVAVSLDSFGQAGSAGTVVLARSDAFADGLAGSSFAQLKDGPLLLTGPGALDARVRAEMVRVLPAGKTVYLLGGTSALSAGLESAVKTAGFAVRRLAGETRYETATTIANIFPSGTATVGVASGENFPDALALSSAAAQGRYPLLLVQQNNTTDAVRTFLSQHPAITHANLAGGTAVLSSVVSTELQNMLGAGSIARYGGKDRFATSAALATGLFGAQPCNVAFASGRTFADALSSGPHAGRHAAPLLLLDAGVPASVQSYLESNPGPIAGAYVYGGTQAVTQLTEAQADGMFEPDTFVFWGDSGESNTHWNNIAAEIVTQVQAGGVDGLLMLGDNFYPAGVATAADPAFGTLYEGPLANAIARSNLYVTLGNHDVLTANGQAELDYATTHPWWILPARYYARDVQHTCLVSLETNQAAVDQTQLDFLSTACNNPLSLHRLAIGHHPVKSSGLHGINNDEPWMPQLVQPVLESKNFDFYLSGHDHDFEAIVPGTPPADIAYVVSGGASQLRSIGANPQSLQSFSQYHFSKLELYTNFADLTVIGEDGAILWTHRYSM